MNRINHLLTAFIALALVSCNNNAGDKTSTAAADAADAIYYGGDIVTMEGDSAIYAEAIAVKDGKIVFVGSKADTEKMKDDSTVMNDLQGKQCCQALLTRMFILPLRQLYYPLK